MEFEIEDQDDAEGEEVLFDDSTNPSLRRERHRARRLWPTNRHADLGEYADMQKAELIPEEEHQLA